MSTSGTTPFIVGFYDPSIQRHDGEGRTLDDILNFNDSQLERHHDFIQYLFPLPERSPINPRAPVITKEVRDAFLAQAELQRQLQRSLNRMLGFYGFAPIAGDSNQEKIEIQPGNEFERNSKQTWRKRFDHNHLRITRIIRSLRVLGLDGEAKAFHQALKQNDGSGRVSERSFMFWQRAAERSLHLSPEEEDERAKGASWLKEGE